MKQNAVDIAITLAAFMIPSGPAIEGMRGFVIRSAVASAGTVGRRRASRDGPRRGTPGIAGSYSYRTAGRSHRGFSLSSAQDFAASDGTIYAGSTVIDTDVLVDIEAALKRVLSTARGQAMIERLKSEGRTVEIRVNSQSRHEAPMPGAWIDIDPVNLPSYQSGIGVRRATLERVLSHELGHAVFGDEDDGEGRLNNTLKNESPIMSELDGHGRYRRISYP